MKNYKLNMSIVLSCTNNNFRASFIELNLAHKKVIGERLKAMRCGLAAKPQSDL